MGINVRTQKSVKPVEMVMVRTSLEKDLKSCMKCRYFYGNNSQCLVKNCIREDIGKGTIGKDAGLIATGENKEDMCRGCPYRQQGGYCFPCMKKLLKRKETDKQAG